MSQRPYKRGSAAVWQRILEAYAAGTSVAILSARYRVDKSTIYDHIARAGLSTRQTTRRTKPPAAQRRPAPQAGVDAVLYLEAAERALATTPAAALTDANLYAMLALRALRAKT